MTALECAGMHVDDAMEIITGGDRIVTWRQLPLVTMAELLARFDRVKHRHDLAFEGDPVGGETS